MASKSTRLTAFADHLDGVAATLPRQDLGWLQELRAAARDRYAAAGLPTPRLESWKFTNLNRLPRVGFTAAALAEAPAVDSVPVGAAIAAEGAVVVLVNGRFRADLSNLADLPKGATVLGIADALETQDGLLETHLDRIAGESDASLAALNTAQLADGVYLHLAEGVTLERPLHVISIGAARGEPVAFHPRLLLIAEPGSHGCILESHVGAGDGAYFTNTVVEASVGEGAVLQHYKLQNDHPAAWHTATTGVELAARAVYDSFVLQIGGHMARNEIIARILGSHAECHLNGTYLLRGKQHADNTTLIDHAAPESTSREVYKGVVDDQARGVFQGKILVRRNAQKTDGHQVNKTLLLSRGAEIDSKPELEIYADDVKCGHGATAGELDEDALFYLQARGIDPETARGLLIEAFIGETIDEILRPTMRNALRDIVAGWLTDGRHDGATGNTGVGT
ncbi:MAG: Fe-S cluster assembly protein SufD [Alphaproteobacteria bacterium]|nr:Fe-S cluster assembly protein SufD [Alphaproteobacteria bacterium]